MQDLRATQETAWQRGDRVQELKQSGRDCLGGGREEAMHMQKPGGVDNKTTCTSNSSAIWPGDCLGGGREEEMNMQKPGGS